MTEQHTAAHSGNSVNGSVANSGSLGHRAECDFTLALTTLLQQVAAASHNHQSAHGTGDNDGSELQCCNGNQQAQGKPSQPNGQDTIRNYFGQQGPKTKLLRHCGHYKNRQKSPAADNHHQQNQRKSPTVPRQAHAPFPLLFLTNGEGDGDDEITVTVIDSTEDV